MFGEYKIRRYKSEDHAGLIQFLTISFLELGKQFLLNEKDTDIRDIEDHYLKNRGSFYVVESGGEICGSVGIRRLSEEIAELKRLYVAKNHRGNELGKTLCCLAIKDATSAGFKYLRLDTTNRSKAALKLFTDLGFQRIDRYNSNPVAEIFMEKIL